MRESAVQVPDTLDHGQLFYWSQETHLKITQISVCLCVFSQDWFVCVSPCSSSNQFAIARVPLRWENRRRRAPMLVPAYGSAWSGRSWTTQRPWPPPNTLRCRSWRPKQGRSTPWRRTHGSPISFSRTLRGPCSKRSLKAPTSTCALTCNRWTNLCNCFQRPLISTAQLTLVNFYSQFPLS